MVFRTDLALETAQNAVSLSEKDFYKDEKRIGRLTVTTLKLHTAAAAKAVGKPCGTYVTVEMPALSDDEKELLEGAAVLAKALTSMLPKSGTVLTVGLGNRGITPDALGPRAADMVLATHSTTLYEPVSYANGVIVPSLGSFLSGDTRFPEMETGVFRVKLLCTGGRVESWEWEMIPFLAYDEPWQPIPVLSGN